MATVLSAAERARTAKTLEAEEGRQRRIEGNQVSVPLAWHLTILFRGANLALSIVAPFQGEMFLPRGPSRGFSFPLSSSIPPVLYVKRRTFIMCTASIYRLQSEQPKIFIRWYDSGDACP